MKILITVQTYYPKKDGVAMVTKYLAEGLVKKGNEVEVLTTSRGGLEDKCNEIINGVTVNRINLITKWGFNFGDKKTYKQIIEEKVSYCDVMINVCTQNAFTDLLLKDLHKYNCKKILYLHGIFDFKLHKIDFSSFTSFINKIWKEARWLFYYLFNSKKFKKYDVVTQLHEMDYSTVFFSNMYGIKSTIIENAADDDFFEPKIPKDFIKPFDKYLLLVANYDDRKNQKLVIEKFLNSNIDKEVGLVLIGSKKNKYYDMLEKYIQQKRKKMQLLPDEKRIMMLYGVDRKYISSYVSNAYLYLMASKWEAYPISLIESMASGIPFISTDVGIVKYFLGGIVTNEKDYVYWIEKIVNNEKIRNKLSELCKEYANEHSKIADKVDKLQTIIDSIAKKKTE